MSADEIRRRSRWMIRALEWDDSRARYPNIWHEGMPAQIMAYETVASRLRLGDLVAVFHPTSQRHPARGDRFVGIARVVGLRRAAAPSTAWVELQTAHRFDPPLDLGEGPRRVFLCCDPEWPARDVALFRRVVQAAIAAGWRALPGELEERAPVPAEAGPGRVSEAVEEEQEPAVSVQGEEHEPLGEEALASGAQPSRPADRDEPRGFAPIFHPTPGARLFGGVDFSGDMRDPKDGTWLALLELRDTRLRVVRLEATGRVGLQAQLRDSDAALLQAEAIGLDFPFGLPVPFAESLLGKAFPEEGWWALARKLERLSRPFYLVKLQEFRDAHGEVKRLTDDRAGAFSPLHRINPDLGPMTYQGIRMIADERSRYVIRPFENAKGRLFLEVYPGEALRRLGIGSVERGERASAILAALAGASRLPVDLDPPFVRRCLARRDALDAVTAARCAAEAVLSGEAEKSPEELAPGNGDQVRKEGWIYGLAESA